MAGARAIFLQTFGDARHNLSHARQLIKQMKKIRIKLSKIS